MVFLTATRKSSAFRNGSSLTDAQNVRFLRAMNAKRKPLVAVLTVNGRTPVSSDF